MPPAASSLVPSNSFKHGSQQYTNHYRDAVHKGVKAKVHQLVEAGVLRPARPNQQCSGNWKPRMDLVDDPSSPNIIAIFELPGVKHEDMKLHIQDRQIIVTGTRIDPSIEALAVAKGVPEEALAQLISTKPSGGVTNVAHSSSTALMKMGNPVTSSIPPSLKELRYGSFYRSVPTPEGINPSEVSACIRAGMLIVTWPRVPTAARSSAAELAPISTPTGTVMNSVDAIPTTQIPDSGEISIALQ